jgi:hypothetical protein
MIYHGQGGGQRGRRRGQVADHSMRPTTYHGHRIHHGQGGRQRGQKGGQVADHGRRGPGRITAREGYIVAGETEEDTTTSALSTANRRRPLSACGLFGGFFWRPRPPSPHMTSLTTISLRPRRRICFWPTAIRLRPRWPTADLAVRPQADSGQ